MKNRGFTLVELLGIIAILAVIALIAVPLVSKIIDHSKEHATLQSARIYMNAVKLSINNENIDSTFLSGRVSCSIIEKDTTVEGAKYTKGDLKCTNDEINYTYIKVKADKTKSIKGTIVFNDGDVDKYSTWFQMDDLSYYGYKKDIIVKLTEVEANEYLISSLEPGLYTENLNLVKDWKDLLTLGLNLNSGSSNSSLFSELPTGKILVMGTKDRNGLAITEIGSHAFDYCANLTNIVIPYSVTSIGDYAFGHCLSLTNITIPNNVKEIRTYAFHSCTNLVSVKIGTGVTIIWPAIFPFCNKLESIIVDFNNIVYDSRNNSNAIIKTDNNTLVAGCKNTVIPNNVVSIGEDAFYQITSLKSIEIPSSVTSIQFSAFNTTGLTNITIPSSITSIGQNAFYNCTGLKSIIIPSSVTSIGGNAFGGIHTVIYDGEADGNPWGAGEVIAS